MKKLFFSLMAIVAITAGVNAQVTNNPNPMATTPATQPENSAYWYYPSQNVYYNESKKSYWYYDKSTTKWSSGSQLSDPYTMPAETDTRYKVTYKGNDVWKGNDKDKMKYKVKKNGTVKTKTKPAGNKN